MAKRGTYVYRGGTYPDAYLRHRAYVGSKDTGALISLFDVHPIAGDWLALAQAKAALAAAEAGDFAKGPLLEEAEALVAQKQVEVAQAEAALQQAGNDLLAMGQAPSEDPEHPEVRAQWLATHQAMAQQEAELQKAYDLVNSELAIYERNLPNIAEQRRIAAISEAEAAVRAAAELAKPITTIEVAQPWAANLKPEEAGYAAISQRPDVAGMADYQE